MGSREEGAYRGKRVAHAANERSSAWARSGSRRGPERRPRIVFGQPGGLADARHGLAAPLALGGIGALGPYAQSTRSCFRRACSARRPPRRSPGWDRPRGGSGSTAMPRGSCRLRPLRRRLGCPTLVAAVAGHELGLDTEGTHQTVRDFAERGVSGDVPERVVDDLELVDVDEEQRRCLAEESSHRHGLLEPVIERLSVVDAGQPVRSAGGRPPARCRVCALASRGRRPSRGAACAAPGRAGRSPRPCPRPPSQDLHGAALGDRLESRELVLEPRIGVVILSKKAVEHLDGRTRPPSAALRAIAKRRRPPRGGARRRSAGLRSSRDARWAPAWRHRPAWGPPTRRCSAQFSHQSWIVSEATPSTSRAVRRLPNPSPSAGRDRRVPRWRPEPPSAARWKAWGRTARRP